MTEMSKAGLHVKTPFISLLLGNITSSISNRLDRNLYTFDVKVVDMHLKRSKSEVGKWKIRILRLGMMLKTT